MRLVDRLLPRIRPMRLTPRGGLFLGGAAVGLIAAYATGWPALLAVALFLGGSVVAALCTVVVAPVALVIERTIDPPIAEQRQEVRVRVAVRGRSPGALEWEEELPRSVVVTGRAEGVLPAVREDRAVPLLDYGFSARVRGEVPVGPLRIARTDPLGLATTRRRVGVVDRVVVLPRIHAVELPFAVRRNDPDSRASTVFGAAGDQRDIIARAYRSGDPFRSVDWRATARRGELMVRTETAASAASTALVLDTRTESWPESAAFEWAVEYAASLLVALQDRQAEIRFAAGRDTTADPTQALVRLATVDRAGGRPGLTTSLLGTVAPEVQVVHVLTGAGGIADVAALPPLPHGAIGLASVVARHAKSLEAPPGWRVVQRDSAAAVGSARDA